MSEMSKGAREALHRCYQYLLSLPAEPESEKGTEDADQPGSDTASPELTSTEAVEGDPSLAHAEQSSSDGRQSQ